MGQKEEAQPVSIPKLNEQPTEQLKKKILGKIDESNTQNAMQVALKRYEQDLEQKR